MLGAGDHVVEAGVPGSHEQVERERPLGVRRRERVARRPLARLPGGAQVVHGVPEDAALDEVDARPADALEVERDARASRAPRRRRRWSRPPRRRARPRGPTGTSVPPPATARRTRSRRGSRRAWRRPRARARRCAGRARGPGAPGRRPPCRPARRPISAGSSSSTPGANTSANPLPPSPPPITVVTDAIVVGAQQNWPSVFATATSLAVVSNAPAAANPDGHAPTSSATPFARRSGVVAAVASSKREASTTSSRGARPGNSGSGATTPAISRALSAARRAPSGEKSFVAATPDRPGRDHPDAEPRVLAPRALMDRARGEAGEPSPLVQEEHLDPVRAGDLQRRVRDAPDLVGADDAGHQPRTPTCTPRNLAGDAPCPTRAVCPGCPFPQLGVPHRVQSSRPPTASHERQNSVVIPV